MSETSISDGTTPSERYLARLGRQSFLSLWCYPNLFRDQRSRNGGDGKELCDLLVVCGDHVLIFSDKTIAWPQGDHININWSRWARRALQASVKQVRGAQRWIAEHPDRIFLDRPCSKPFPLALPAPEKMKVHGIVVALGAGAACRQHFKGGSGSLMVEPRIAGDSHWTPGDPNFLPFAIGDICPDGSFIHVFDDTTLDVVMHELDTITDLTSYLEKKADLIRSGKLTHADGEEDLLAYY